jgi:chemotaxis protein CheD
MGDLDVGRSPDVLTTFGLGSCLGLAVYDREAKIGGLAHIMLPDSQLARGSGHAPGKFVDTAVPELLRRLLTAGAQLSRCRAKLVGAASMFAAALDPVRLVGPRNVDAARALLDRAGIAVESQDVGGAFGRTVTLYMESGRLAVRTVKQGTREL